MQPKKKSKQYTPRSESQAAKIRAMLAAHPDLNPAQVASLMGVPANRVYTIRWIDTKRAAAKPAVEPTSKPAPERPANDVQVGGTHYKNKAIQPWDYITSNDMGFLAGNVVKYVTRYKEKGGVADLEKARHYLDKLIETERADGGDA